MFLYVEFLLTYKTIWDGSFWERSQIIPLGFSLLELVLATELLWGQGNSHCTGLRSSEHVTDACSHGTVPLALQSVIPRSLVSVTNGGLLLLKALFLHGYQWLLSGSSPEFSFTLFSFTMICQTYRYIRSKTHQDFSGIQKSIDSNVTNIHKPSHSLRAKMPQVRHQPFSLKCTFTE